MLAEHLGPESDAAQQQAAVINDKFNDIPKAYVHCSLDQTIDINLQSKMIAETHCGEVAQSPLASRLRPLKTLMVMSAICRCMIPSSGFFEWTHKGPKAKYQFP